MLAKTGLLVISNPMQISKILSSVQKQVKNTLYIQLLSALNDPFGHYHPTLFNSWPKFSQTITKIYTQVASECEHLDVRVLLSGLKQNIQSIQTQKPIDLVIFDKLHSQIDVDNFLKARISNINKECSVLMLESGQFIEPTISANDGKIYKHTVLGGTFDRLHIAHKLLLTEALLRANEKITVGVTEENMLQGKILWELIEPVNERVESVKNFLEDVCPELAINVVPITDPFGPTQNDPTMELIVVSAETLKGGIKVNELREKNGLSPVEMLSVELIDEPHRNPNEETKISSSTGRMRLLGTLLKPVNSQLNRKPYVIGLTGGIGSGKSGVAKHLSNLGAQIINCDLIAHEVYMPGKQAHTLIQKEFGDRVIAEDGTINRKELGSIVFSNPDKLRKLNELVWPEIASEARKLITESTSKVVVIEAAVLLTAGWENMCHEVWSTLVPRDEAILRLKNRNNLTEDEATARINSQKDNKYYVNNAHVVLCTLWPVEYTKQQVQRAWNLLNERI